MKYVVIMARNYSVINRVHVRIISEMLMTKDLVHIKKRDIFLHCLFVLPAVVGRCCSQLASIVDLVQLSKSLLAHPIPFYV